jgi:hypothetical protein
MLDAVEEIIRPVAGVLNGSIRSVTFLYAAAAAARETVGEERAMNGKFDPKVFQLAMSRWAHQTSSARRIITCKHSG